jgi:hypothetical protein
LTRWRTRHRGSHAERGAAAVEFAIVLVVLLLIIFAIIDFGRLLFVSQSMKAASREGARTAAVTTTAGSVATAVANAGDSAVSLAGGTPPPYCRVLISPSGAYPAEGDAFWRRGQTPDLWRSALGTYAAGSVTYTLTDCSGVPCAVSGAEAIKVYVSSPFRWFTPVGIFSSNVNAVDASTTMRCE